MPKFPQADARLDSWLAGRADKPLHRELTLERRWETPARNDRLNTCYRRGAPPAALLAEGPDWSVDLSRPVRLLPVTVAKPWGREVWYTAIEARGESLIETADGVRLSLASYLALAPRRLSGARTPILAKRLEPSPEPQLGDLYLETHDAKQELYIVTRLHPQAWPEGLGRLRLGIDPARRRRALSDDALRSDFLQAVEAYRLARDQSGPADASREQRARMLAFVAEAAVREGSVVHVPAGVPHRLAHGIEVVELQTPSYQRRVIASDQPMPAQQPWDSAAAIARLSLERPPPAASRALPVAATGRSRGPVDVERLPDVAGCRVLRARLDRGVAWQPTAADYQLLLILAGGVRLGGLALGPGDAAWLPTADCLAEDAGWVESPDCATLVLHATPT